MLKASFERGLDQPKEEVHIPLTRPSVPGAPEHPVEVESDLKQGSEKIRSKVEVFLTKPHSLSSMVIDLSNIWVNTSIVHGTLFATNSITVVPSDIIMSRWAWLISVKHSGFNFVKRSI